MDPGDAINWLFFIPVAILALAGLAMGGMYILAMVAFVLHLPWVVLNRLWRKWVPDS